MKKVLLFSLAFAASISSWAQTFSGGSGTEADPYKITKAADFNELATEVNDNANTFTGKYFALENDITFTSDYTHTPIGKWISAKEMIRFNGVFDGKNHTLTDFTFTTASTDRFNGLFALVDTAGVIKNLTFNNPTITANLGTSLACGTVVGDSYGTVDNVHVKNGTISSTATGYRGGIVGLLRGGGYVLNSSYSGNMTSGATFAAIVGQHYGVVRNCWSDATLTATLTTQTYTGGIIGVALGTMANKDDPQVEVSNSYFYGTISSLSGNCGGIAGQVNKAKIDQCWNAGYIQSGGYTGGVIGSLISSTLTNCYNAGTVYNVSKEFVGGLVGSMTAEVAGYEIKNCLNLGKVFNSVTYRNAGCEIIGYNSTEYVPENMYFDSQMTGYGYNVGNKTTKELTSGTALDGFSTDIWTFTSGLYPRLKSFEKNELAILCATPIYLADGETHEKVTKDFTVGTGNDVEWEITGTTQAKISGGNVTVTRGDKVATAVLNAYLGNYQKRTSVDIYPSLFTGAGTETDPYIISTYKDMQTLSDATNNQSMSFNGEFFKMANDIDMQNDTSFNIISRSESFSFAGTFDGQNHSIKNWAFDNYDTNVLWNALFAYVAPAGTIKNVVIDKSCDLKYSRNGAALVSKLYGTVENCRNFADVKCRLGYTGGLVYLAMEGSKITDSYNGGNVTSADKGYLGGIAYSTYATSVVDGCQNAGDIVSGGTTCPYVGGLIGSAKGTVSNCLNTGKVSGSTNVGGIAGGTNSTTFKNVLSLGVVDYSGDKTYVGGLVGKFDTGSKYENAVFDTQITLYNNYENTGISGKLTSEIVSAAFAEGADSKWETATGMYPQLKAFKDIDGANVGTFPVAFDAADTRSQISGNATLAKAEGLTWTLAKGTYFSVDGTTLKYNGSDDSVEDTLVATYNGATKYIPIGALGTLFSGKGSAADPWLIQTSADLVKLSTTVTEKKNDFNGKYFAVTNDIDMQDVTFSPIGNATASAFNASFDGRNHAISNLTISSATADYIGLFGKLGLDAEVKNLTLKSGTIAGKNYVGGIAGYAEGSITNVVNYANVTGQKYVGGIAGDLVSATAKYDSLKNYGTIAATYASGRAGGIAGETQYASISNSENYGAVSSAKAAFGGIVGYVQHGGVYTRCANFADMEGYGPAGGIVGANYLTTTQKSDTLKIFDCYNTGDITSTYFSVGGIVGDIANYTERSIVTNVANTGNITNTKAKILDTAGGAAGIVCKGNPVIANAFNSGTITAQNSVGGIVGMIGSTSYTMKISNSVNTGSIEGYADASANVGAITGKSNKNVLLENNAYDKQMCNVEGIAKADADGAKGYTTYDLVNNFVPATGMTSTAMDNATDFHQESVYPYPTALAADSAVLVAAVPLYLDAADTRYDVTKAFRVATPSEAYAWTMPDVFTKSGYNVAVKEGTAGDYEVTVGYGSFSRVYKLKLDVPTGIEKALAGEGAGLQLTNGGIALPAGQYAVHNLSGTLLKSGNAAGGETISLPAGLYVVRAAGAATKVVIK